ncbi:MAG TPA: Sec-independent protein translocase subunit TatA [Mycobacterium sp.]|nr:Sec-independent protein translocase subunit TatA [Mycobacterium sp.]
MWNTLQPWHLIVLVVVLILVFGSKKLPDAARSLGKSMRIFKSEMHELQHERKPEVEAKPDSAPSARVDTPTPEQNHTDARPA